MEDTSGVRLMVLEGSNDVVLPLELCLAHSSKPINVRYWAIMVTSCPDLELTLPLEGSRVGEEGCVCTPCSRAGHKAGEH